MKKMISIAALSLFVAAPAFAQDTKPAIGATTSAPAASVPAASTVAPAVKPAVDAGKVLAAPLAAPQAGQAGATSPSLVKPAQVQVPVTAPVTPVAPKADAGRPDATKTVQPVTTGTPPAVTDKKADAAKIDTKPMAIGAPKVDEKKPEAAKTATPAAAVATPPPVKAIDTKPLDSKPADIKKQ